jgi:predicted nuclease with TOPRIM domain
MKKALCLFICLIVGSISNNLVAQDRVVRFSDIRSSLEEAVSKLSSNIKAFEEILDKMDESAKANQDYNEQKNIFLSSQFAITSIVSILEYNRDLLVLFGDLREKNRNKFYEVRIESLETSIQQIKNMHKQIQINYTILPPDFYEWQLIDRERRIILSSMDLLEQCIALLKSVNQK